MTLFQILSFVALATFFTAKIAKSADVCTQETLPEVSFADEMWDVIYPESADTNLHYLYKNYKMNSPLCKKGEVWVQGPVFEEAGLNSLGKKVDHNNFSVSKLGTAFCISKKEFDQSVALANSVFETRVSSGSKNEGTSFLVGDNIIMTNHHIGAPGPDGKDCKKLEISLNKEPQEWIPCKRVLFCDKQKDFCFVEMQMPPGKKLSSQVPKLSLDCSSIVSQKAKIIGNTYKLGIQASKGPIIGSPDTNGRFKHRIPMTGGASGSPILNSAGKVIGINFGHTPGDDFVSDDAKSYNFGSSMQAIWSHIKIAKMTSANYTPFLSNGDAEDINKVYDIFRASPSCK